MREARQKALQRHRLGAKGFPGFSEGAPADKHAPIERKQRNSLLEVPKLAGSL